MVPLLCCKRCTLWMDKRYSYCSNAFHHDDVFQLCRVGTSGREPLLTRIRAAEKTPDPYLKIDPLARSLVKWGKVPILVFNFVVLGAVCSYGIGAANARLQAEFVELATSPNSLAVRAYGDLLISIKVDPATKTATGETVVLKISDSATILRVKAKVGPIQRPTELLVR